MTFKEHLKSVYKTNFANFSGRASLSEYWFTYISAPLIYILACLPMIPLALAFGQDGYNAGLVIYCFVAIPLLVPQLAVTVRRLHDSGKSAWWVLIVLVPYGIGLIVLLFFLLKESDGDNRWGKPKQNLSVVAPNSLHSTQRTTDGESGAKIAEEISYRADSIIDKTTTDNDDYSISYHQTESQAKQPMEQAIKPVTQQIESTSSNAPQFTNVQLAAMYKMALGIIGASSTGLTEKKLFVLSYGMNRFNVSTSVLEQLIQSDANHIARIFGLDSEMSPSEMVDTLSVLDNEKKKYVSAYLQLIIAADGKLEDNVLLFWKLNATFCKLPTMSIEEATIIFKSL